MAKYNYEASLEGHKKTSGTHQFRLFFVGDDKTFSNGGPTDVLNAKALAAVKTQNPGFMAEYNLKSAEVRGYTKRGAVAGSSSTSSQTSSNKSNSKTPLWWLPFKFIFGLLWKIIKVANPFKL
jgi:hypothetical protein